MANYFSTETTVLNFYPHSHVRYSLRGYLLWPAFTYRVVAPDFYERQLNFIQRAILGFCRADIIDPENITRRLYIHSDLVAFIQLQLQELGYLNDNCALTRKGAAAINDDEYSLDKAVIGNVFQDPWNGDLWPRFVESLNQPEKEYDENGYPMILLRTKKKRFPIKPFMEIPRDQDAVFFCPDPEDILGAVARHSRALKFREYYATNASHDEVQEDINIDITPHKLKRVSLIDPTPLPVFLMTYLYVPENLRDGEGWFVCDPFGLGASPTLKKSIEKQFKEDPKLLHYVEKTFAKKQEYIASMIQNYETNRIQAELKIEELLGIEVRGTPLFEALVSMQCALQEIIELGQNCRSDKLKDVLIKTQSVLEGMFIHLRGKFPIDNAWKLLYSRNVNDIWKPMDDRNYRKELLNRIADSMKYSVPLPESLISVKPEKVRSISLQSFGSLRPYLIANILAASTNPKHPLRFLAVQDPMLLTKMSLLANLRDVSGHYQTEKTDIRTDLDQVSSQVDFCFSAVKMFLKYLMEESYE